MSSCKLLFLITPSKGSAFLLDEFSKKIIDLLSSSQFVQFPSKHLTTSSVLGLFTQSKSPKKKFPITLCLLRVQGLRFSKDNLS
jgi:hypothetical protein